MPPADGARSAALPGAAYLSKRWSSGGQSSSPTPGGAPATTGGGGGGARGGAAWGARARVGPANAAPVPMASTWSTTAEPVAAHGATPARWDMTAMPAIAQTLPGRYFP